MPTTTTTTTTSTTTTTTTPVPNGLTIYVPKWIQKNDGKFFTFDHWSGDASGTNHIITDYELTTDKEITANYAEINWANTEIFVEGFGAIQESVYWYNHNTGGYCQMGENPRPIAYASRYPFWGMAHFDLSGGGPNDRRIYVPRFGQQPGGYYDWFWIAGIDSSAKFIWNNEMGEYEPNVWGRCGTVRIYSPNDHNVMVSRNDGVVTGIKPYASDFEIFMDIVFGNFSGVATYEYYGSTCSDKIGTVTLIHNAPTTTTTTTTQEP